MFEKFFTTYNQTDSPPIKTEGYLENKNKIDFDLNPFLEKEDLDIKPKYDDTQYPSYNTGIEYFNYNPEVTPTKQYVAPLATPSTGVIANVINTAAKYVGNTKYVWGGNNPNTGFDCSGLIQYAYKQQGINLPRTVKEMSKTGKEVPLSEARPGDVLISKSRGPSGHHIQLVSKVDDNGNITTIEAMGKKYGLVEQPLRNTGKIFTVRRFVDQA